jgi:hypothetical protein
MNRKEDLDRLEAEAAEAASKEEELAAKVLAIAETLNQPDQRLDGEEVSDIFSKVLGKQQP